MVDLAQVERGLAVIEGQLKPYTDGMTDEKIENFCSYVRELTLSGKTFDLQSVATDYGLETVVVTYDGCKASHNNRDKSGDAAMYLAKGNLRLKDGSLAHQKAVAKLSATSTEGPNWKHWRISPHLEKGFVVFESLVSAGLMESGVQHRVGTYTHNLDPNNTPKFRKAIEKQMIDIAQTDGFVSMKLHIVPVVRQEAEVVTTQEWLDAEAALTVVVGAGNPGGMKKEDKMAGGIEASSQEVFTWRSPDGKNSDQKVIVSITKGDVEEAKENIRKFLRKVDVFIYPPRFYLWCSIVAADVYFSREIGSSVTELCRLEALAKALEYSIANKRDKASFKNLVMQRLLGYAKVNGKYYGPDGRVWQHHGALSGEFRRKLLKYVKKLLESPAE